MFRYTCACTVGIYDYSQCHVSNVNNLWFIIVVTVKCVYGVFTRAAASVIYPPITWMRTVSLLTFCLQYPSRCLPEYRPKKKSSPNTMTVPVTDSQPNASSSTLSSIEATLHASKISQETFNKNIAESISQQTLALKKQMKVQKKTWMPNLSKSKNLLKR